MSIEPKRRETVKSVRLRLECGQCYQQRTLWVDPEQSVQNAARQSDWHWQAGRWYCPRCMERLG